MRNYTAEQSQEWRKERTQETKIYHRELIDNLGISVDDFTLKSPFENDQGVLVVGIFPSEFKKTKGTYFELAQRFSNPSTIREVYKVPFSADYHEEYELKDNGSYAVPVEELKRIDVVSLMGEISKNEPITSSAAFCSKEPNISYPKKETPVKITNVPSSNDDNNDDAPYSQMTIRDYYAIHSGKAVSKKEWLNNLIKNYK